MMTYTATATPTSQANTCATCPHFQSHQEPRYIEIEDGTRIANSRYGAGWCRLFDQFCKEQHKQIQNCINSSNTIISHELEDNLALFSDVNFEELDPFPTEVIELDRNGYLMEEAEPTGYFALDFVTNSNEPF